jgi:hypothetical protein
MEKIMNAEINYITNRAKITRHAQEDLKSSWMWNETTLDQWDSDIAELHRMQEVCSSAEFTRNSARAALDAGLLEIHRLTMQFLAMAKFHFRNDPAKLEALNRLTSTGLGRRAIAQEALDVESAWQKIGPEWAPTEANTLTAFQALRKQCTELDAAFIAAFSALRTQSEVLKQKAASMNEAVIAWYAAATRIYPTGTAEGDTIRRSIPTRYSPPVASEPPAPAPQPTEVM